MRWKRVKPHKENTEEQKNYMQVYNPPPKKNFLNKIKEKILNKLNNFSKEKKPKQKEKYYQIDPKVEPKDTFTKTTSILAIAIIIAVIT